MKKEAILAMLQSVDPDDPRPLYSQIIGIICLALAAGSLKPGDRLPSTRELARALRINLNTSARTYKDLTALGLILSRRGVGMFITEEAPALGRKIAEETIDSSLQKSLIDARKMGLTDTAILSQVKRILSGED